MHPTRQKLEIKLAFDPNGGPDPEGVTQAAPNRINQNYLFS